MVHFPYGYDPGKTYPLTVYLHGSGPNYTMDGMKMAFDNSRQDTLYDWNEIDPENVPAPLRGFLIAPWARGNARYKGLAREDVLQAIEEMRDRFSIDSERMYLTGFSMGSGGAWRLATEKPELWAGVNLASGFDTSNLTEERIEKIREIPFILQVGEKETERVSACEVFYERLKAAGVSVSRYVIEDMPHTYPHALYCRNVDELMQSPR
jgi:predicted peptidase